MSALRWKRAGLLRAIAGIFLLSASLAAFASPANELRQLQEAGKAGEAYRLGSQHPEQLGDPEFDMYFGMAAVDAGHAAEGVLALERYLLVFPDNQQARLELARGYFILGEDARAREEFEAVLALAPPASVIANINRFLDALRSREARYQTSARGYLEAGIGTDSNVNGGVGSSVSLPVLGPVAVSGQGRRKGDWVNHFGAGAQVVQPVAPGRMLFAGVDWERKEMHRHDAFDTESLAINGGGSLLLGDHLLRGVLSYSTLLVDRNSYRQLTGIGAEWQHQLNELEMLSAGAQYAWIRHAGDVQVRDANLTAATLGYRRALAIDWQPVLSASLTVADEKNQESTPARRDDLGRMIYGARIGVTATPAPRWGVSASLSYTHSRYQDEDAILVKRRLDRANSLDLGVTYLIDRNWSIRGEATFTDNAANIELYAHRRNAVGVKLRYEFK